MKKSSIFRGMTTDGSARILVLNSTSIVNRMVTLHQTMPTATAALGRLLTATSMLGSMMGEKQEKMTIGILGDGIAGKILAVSDYYGNVKGYIENPSADPVRKENGKLNVSLAVGKGTLYVARDNGVGEPHVGTVGLQSGEIAEDIAAYYAYSEQIPTLCALGVLVNPDRSCRSAGGVIVQLLPFADEAIIEKLEENIKKMANVSSLFEEGLSEKEIADIVLEGIPYDPFDEIAVKYQCDCSRERMHKGMMSVGIVELQKMLDEQQAEGKPRELTAECQFCNKSYVFTEEELKNMATDEQED